MLGEGKIPIEGGVVVSQNKDSKISYTGLITFQKTIQGETEAWSIMGQWQAEPHLDWDILRVYTVVFLFGL